MAEERGVRSRIDARAPMIALCVVMLAMMLGGGVEAVPSFGAPARVGAEGFEPGIDIGGDGAIFVNSTVGIPVRSPVWRSTDGGDSWTRLQIPTPLNRFPGGGDVDVAVGPNGRVYHLDLWAGSNTITVSRDNGETWSYGSPFTTLPLTDRQWLAVGGPGSLPETDVLYVSYQLIQPPGSTMIARSDDGGLTWAHHALPHGPIDTLPGQVVAAGDFVAVSYRSGPELWVARSTDAGMSWTTSRVDRDGDVYGAIFSAAGLSLSGQTLVATWISSDGYKVKVARSTDRGATWDPPVTVSAGANTNIFPWVAVRGSKVGVAWYGASVAGDPNGFEPAATWRVYYAERVDAGGAFSAPVAASGVVKTGAVCTRGLGCSADRNLGDFLQLALTASGHAIISFVNAAGAIGPPGVYVARQS